MTTTMTTTTKTTTSDLTLKLETANLSGPANRIYQRALGKVRDQVVAGTLTAADWQDAQADILLYISQVFGARMWA